MLRRSCCPSDVAGGGLKRRQTIGLKGDVTIGLKGGVEEGSDPIAALADRKVASDEANPYARRRVVLAWQPAERHAPGAQLHSTRVDQCGASSRSKLMHLLVLSAFRLRPQKTAPQRRLPERNRRRPGKRHIESARTCPIKPHNREKPPQNDPAPPTPLTSQYATDFQRTQAKKPTPHDYVKVNFVLLGIQNSLLQSDDYFASGRTDTGLH